MLIKGLAFMQTCPACPEQYDVLDSSGGIVGYVRLRFGALRCDYPDIGGETIYTYNFNDKWLGSFPGEECRIHHLEAIADKILEKLNSD